MSPVRDENAPMQVDGMDYSADIHLLGIKDPFHGNIKVYRSLALFIDTTQLQRLRNIKQLGTTSYVWPAATHTRFEHSLGVACLARRMATHLQIRQPNLGITNRDIACVEIAGLCHDLGHGPWSHVWDNLFIPIALKGKKWTHEIGSEMMFDYLIRDNEVPMSQKDQDFVKALISGDYSRVPDEKSFLFDIVANRRNGLDVDKFDYLLRDSVMSNHSINLDLDRLIESARVLDDQICYNIKDVNLIYDFFSNRFNMHKDVYNHKTTKAVEHMIIDALLAADPYLNISQRIFDPEQYLQTTDHIMSQIEWSKEPELAESRAILKAIRKRQLYKHVDFKVIEWPMQQIFRDNITPQNIVNSVHGLLSPSISEDAGVQSMQLSTVSTLEVSDVVVDFSTRSYGMKEKNPVDCIRFYSKRNPYESSKADRGVITSLLPQYFQEVHLNIFAKKEEHRAMVQAGYRAILSRLQEDVEVGSPEAIEDNTQDGTIATPALMLANHANVPSTPTSNARSLQRSTSIRSIGSFNGSFMKDSTPFSNNTFTTLPMPISPSQGRSCSTAAKRKREENADPNILSNRQRQ